jgi:hypothetical protein
MKIFILILVTLSFSSFGRAFKIPKGSHRSLPIQSKAFVGTKMEITAIFDESARYEFPIETMSDQSDLNKLYGFSDCAGSHLQNSARFGWNWYQNKLSVYALTHSNGRLQFQFISDIEFNKPYKGTIQIHPDKRSYLFNFNGISVQMERGCLDQKAWGYHLFPYFGGQQVAPHDITINVKVDETSVPVIADLPYPNPTQNGHFKMKVSSTERVPFFIVVRDAIGRTVYKSSATYLNKDSTDSLSFDLGKKLPSGIYIITPMVVLADGREYTANVTNKGHDKSFKLVLLNN